MFISSISQFNITGNNKSCYKNTMTKPIGLDTVSFSGKNNTGKTQKKAMELIFDGLDNETKEKILTKQDAQGRTLLMYTLQTGNTKAADGLLNQAPYLAVRNTMVNARDKNGKTPLMYAAETGNTKAVEIILSQAADEREREDMLYAYEQTEEPEPVGAYCDVVDHDHDYVFDEIDEVSDDRLEYFRKRIRESFMLMNNSNESLDPIRIELEEGFFLNFYPKGTLITDGFSMDRTPPQVIEAMAERLKERLDIY